MAAIDVILLTDVAHNKDIKTTPKDADTVSGVDNVREAVRRRIITRPGTLIHRPDYGANLLKYQGAPLTLSKKQEMANAIVENLKREDRVKEVTSISFDESTDGITTVKVKYNIVGYGEDILDTPLFGEV